MRSFNKGPQLQVEDFIIFYPIEFFDNLRGGQTTGFHDWDELPGPAEILVDRQIAYVTLYSCRMM